MNLVPPLYRTALPANQERQAQFLAANGQQSAAAYQHIYGYGASDMNRPYASFYEQFETVPILSAIKYITKLFRLKKNE